MLRPLAIVAVSMVARATLAQSPVPRIVNGIPTGEYPTVGALLFYTDAQRTELDGLCSGTLVGCHTFLTAAHCACAGDAEDADDCERFGLVDRRTIQVYLPHAGFFDVDRLTIHPDFVFAEVGDLAVFELAQAPRGVLPSAINTTARLPFGTGGTLVGFGRTGGRSSEGDNAGLKRQGPVTTTECNQDFSGDTHICWRFTGNGASTCSGDSGGPLFVASDNGLVVAGTTSGGTSETCLAPDFSFDTDVFVHRDFVIAEAGDDVLGERCGEATVVGDDGVSVRHWTGEIGAAREARVELDVPAGTTELRVGLNGRLSSNGMFPVMNRFHLYLRAGAQPSRAVFDCAGAGPSVFAYCEMSDPAPGPWHILVDGVVGGGEWQATATIFTAPRPCIGDCDANGAVTVDELVIAVSSALSGGAIGCDSVDTNGDSQVTVDEIVTAVDKALRGCA
jgi:hypothetical protein